MHSAPRTAHVRGYVAISAFWLAVMGIALFATNRPAPAPIEIIPAPSATLTPLPSPTVTPGPLLVDVAGAVAAPGVYALPAGSAVAAAIAAAGGPLPGADLDRINKAVRLQDGIQVYVPRIAETPPVVATLALPAPTAAPGGAPQPASVETTVDINTASAAELEALPGIGPALAQRIVEGRPYATVEDVLRVRGIGPAIFEKIKPHIVVR